MSTDKILSQLPFYIVHPFMSFLASMIIMMVCIALADAALSKKKVVLGFILGFLSMGGFLFAIAIATGVGLTNDDITLIRKAPVEVTKTQTIDLVSASSAGFAKTSADGSIWSISATTADTTSYRYIVKNGDSYQVKTLHDQFGDVNPNDVSIKQEPGRKQTQLVVESKRYSDSRIRALLSKTSWSPEWQTYTFKVGDGAISTKNSFK